MIYKGLAYLILSYVMNISMYDLICIPFSTLVLFFIQRWTKRMDPEVGFITCILTFRLEYLLHSRTTLKLREYQAYLS